ncbi:unnamed protein product [Dicrocoelium dendriticum]|nr:unnamed protein product [Dicrocoelium dendriticum]
MSLSLIQILDLDEKNQVLTISVWLLFNWKDHILRWNPDNYSQVVEVRVPPKQIWTPDIVLYNYADERLKEMRDAMVVVHYDGSIKWMPPAIFKSNCKIDIKSFPFDEQTCHMKFGSWTYDGNRLDVSFINNEQHVLLDDYTESNEWEIFARPAMRNVKYYPCCQEPYPDLTYFLFLRRNAAFFSYILVLPCVLLSSLTLVIFWLPPESPAKMVLGMNIFVAFFLLLLLLADSTPQASTSVPYIGYYYCLNMVLITLSSFLSVIVINLYFRGDRRNRVPWWIRKFCQVVTKSCRDKGHSETVDEEYKDTASVHFNDKSQLLAEAKDQDRRLPSANFCKPILSVNGRPVRMADDKKRPTTTTTAGRGKQSKTRFANMGPNGRAEDVLLSGQRNHPSHSTNIGRDGAQTSRMVHKRHERDRGEHNTLGSKMRSQSLPPVGDNKQKIIANSGLFAHEGACPFSRIPHPQDDDDYHWWTYCAPTSPSACCHAHSTYCSIGTDSMGRHRHQKHPQSCHMCLQHLNALRKQKSGQSTQCAVCRRVDKNQPPTCTCGHHSCSSSDVTSDHHQHRSNIGACNIAHRPSCQLYVCTQHMANPFPTCCQAQNGSVRYEYRDGQLRLVHTNQPNEMSATIGSFPSAMRHKRLENPTDGNAAVPLIRLTKNLERELQDIREAIRSFLTRIAKKDADNVALREWRMVAKVLDRIFFICYLVIHLGAAFGLLIPSSQETNAIEFMREYRLKNYNATYTDEEAASLSPLALSPVNPHNRVFGRSLDRVIPPKEEGQPQVVMDTIRKKSEKQAVHTDGSFEIKSSSEGVGKLSPYQQLVDKGSVGQRRMSGSSNNHLPQNDQPIFVYTSGPLDAAEPNKHANEYAATPIY